MVTISLCMIVKDEEAVLARCLDSVKDAVDEIIIVDTGSTDGTKEIAKRYTDKIYDFPWINDFSAARNESFSKATMDYQMWLDADDVLPPEECQRLKELKQNLDPTTGIVTMKYYTHFDPQGVPIHVSTRERLLRREDNFQWTDPIHEYIGIVGNTYYSDIVIHHKKNHKEGDSTRNLNVYTQLEASGKPMSPRQLYYFARELKDHGLWIKSAYYFEKFLDSKGGWAEDNIATCHSLAFLYATLGDEEKVLPALTRSFLYDAPRAEILCEIGYHYKRAGDTAKAYKWFRIAANLGEPESIGFILQDYWGYIPNIECCVCAYQLGDMATAKAYNDKAAQYKPNDPSVLSNNKVFENI